MGARSVSPAEMDELQTLRRAVGRDPLTGLANRIEFDARLAGELTTFQQGGPGFALLFLDVDFFKRINDRHGHPAGDRVLIGLADLLIRESDQQDLVARYGGDEFLLILPACDLPTAQQRAERLRAAVEETLFDESPAISVTVSGGVTAAEPGDAPEGPLQRADRALYRAKQSGRNRICSLTASEFHAPAAVADAELRFDDPFRGAARLAASTSLAGLLSAIGELLKDKRVTLTAIEGDRATLLFRRGGMLAGWFHDPVEVTLDFTELATRPGDAGTIGVVLRPLEHPRDTETFQVHARAIQERLRAVLPSPAG